MKYQFIEEHKHEFPIVVMCGVLVVSESGFYAWRKRPTCRRKREDAHLIQEIQQAMSQPTQSTKCTFSGVVPIDFKRFQESGVSLVECPDCTRMWTLEPRGGVLRFKLHDTRKTTTPTTGQRWAKGETDWEVGGE